MARTVLQLLAEMASAWVRLSGPIIPPGANYAQASAIPGFGDAFDAFCAEVSATAEEIAGMQEQFLWPESL